MGRFDTRKMSKAPDTPTYSQFACVGTGFSAIGLGATLKRWYGIGDIKFFERHSDLGGTWFINQYPGDISSLSMGSTKHGCY